jgi:lipoprotein NlpI
VVLVLTLLSVAAQANVKSHSLYARGLVPFNSGEWEVAYRFFDRALEADRTDAQAWYYRGLTQARLGRTLEAIQDLEQASVLNPSLPHAALDLGIAYISAGRWEDARRSLDRAYQQGHEKLTAAFFLGLALYRLDDHANALGYFNEAKTDAELAGAASYYAGLIQIQGDQVKAGRTDFETTTRSLPDSEIGHAAQEYLTTGNVAVPEAAAEAKPWSIYGGLGFEYDSNVTIGPGDTNFNTPVDISGESDGRVVLRAGGRYSFLSSARLSLVSTYDFSQSVHFDLTEYDLQGHRLGLRLGSQKGAFSYGVAGGYNFFALNYQTFFQEGLGTPWLTYAINEWTSTQAYYTIRGRDFFRAPFDPGRDAINHAFGMRQYFALGDPQRVLSVGYQFDIEDTIADGPQGRTFAYQGQQFDLDVQLPVWEDGLVQLGYLFRYDDYDHPESGWTLKRRRDDEHQFVIAATKPISDYVSLQLSYAGIIQSSNVTEFDYDRHIVSGGILIAY